MELNYEAIDEILPLELVKKAASIDRDNDDDLIEAYIHAAVFQIERDTGHLFGVREVTEAFDGFESVRLRAAPVRSILSVAYRDATHEVVMFDLAGLRVVAGSRPARVTRLASAWPTIANVLDAVQVTFEAGHYPEKFPATLRTAALMIVADLWGQRETWTPGTAVAAPMSVSLDHMIQPFRIYSV